jgi:uncharacterized membrane protein
MNEKYIYRFFRLSIYFKGALSLIEIASGVAALLISPAAIGAFIVSVSQNELLENPDDFIAQHALLLGHDFSLTPQIFLAFYFLSRGVIKFGLVVALLKNKLWAYPAALTVLGGFMIYQTYQYFIVHSFWLLALTIFDVIVMWLIWHEYKIVRARVMKDTAPAV